MSHWPKRCRDTWDTARAARATVRSVPMCPKRRDARNRVFSVGTWATVPSVPQIAGIRRALRQRLAAAADCAAADRDGRWGSSRGPTPNASQQADTPRPLASASSLARLGMVSPASAELISVGDVSVRRAASRMDRPQASRASRSRSENSAQSARPSADCDASSPKASKHGDRFRAWASFSTVSMRGRLLPFSSAWTVAEVRPEASASDAKDRPAAFRARPSRAGNVLNLGLGLPRTTHPDSTRTIGALVGSIFSG